MKCLLTAQAAEQTVNFESFNNKYTSPTVPGTDVSTLLLHSSARCLIFAPLYHYRIRKVERVADIRITTMKQEKRYISKVIFA